MIRAAPAGGHSPRRSDPPAGFLRRGLRGSISPAAVDAISQAIQTQEGYYPGSLAYQNNNPGNLVYAGQPGASPGAGGFARFSSYAAGYAALQNQITLDASRGTDVNGNPTTTINQLISSWAPASDGNNTAAYVSSVAQSTGYDPDAPLSSLDAGSGFSPVPVPDDAAAFFSSLPAVDLSSLGVATPVPLPVVVGVGLLGLLALRSL